MSLEEHHRTSLAHVHPVRPPDPRPGRRYSSLMSTMVAFSQAMQGRSTTPMSWAGTSKSDALVEAATMPLVNGEGAKLTRQILGRPKNQPAYRQILKSKY